MYLCNYCGRHLKKKYEKCPACGSTSFKHIQNYGEEVIKEPPKDGYKVNFQNFKYEKKFHWPFVLVGLFIAVFTIIFVVLYVSPFFEDGKFNMFGIPFALFAIIALIVAMANARKFFSQSKEIRSKSNNDIDKVKHLAKNGMLIKNLKYTIKPVKEMIQGNKTVYQIQVIYEIEKGKTKKFLSEPKYLSALGRDDGTVDLLVDPDDYSNYFIDFEIY